jgi:hypothetical protein
MFLNEITFQMKIEEIVKVKKIDHLDAVLDFCKTYGMDPEEVKKLITVNLKAKIRDAAANQGLMRPLAQLPFD